LSSHGENDSTSRNRRRNRRTLGVLLNVESTMTKDTGGLIVGQIFPEHEH
jgi:hypothetical protein